MTATEPAVGHEACPASREGCLVRDTSTAAVAARAAQAAALVTAQRAEGYRFTCGYRHALYFEPIHGLGWRRDERRFVAACDGTYYQADDTDGVVGLVTLPDDPLERACEGCTAGPGEACRPWCLSHDDPAGCDHTATCPPADDPTQTDPSLTDSVKETRS